MMTSSCPCLAEETLCHKLNDFVPLDHSFSMRVEVGVLWAPNLRHENITFEKQALIQSLVSKRAYASCIAQL